ncbi:hypothetical protein CBR_g16023 [Chara braunii]|uniref:Uncharacterized protein n=1 Tax=Chara braunii TaxID=69332 RepID=A0A388JT14_CHABU|nr:hypothetical protein CBR_g16023 [Chara braunii]|eukprot:GBG60903.1 hypothetical protein CBR_g16023 [Chara braunii]
MSPRGGGGSRARGKKRDAPHDDAGGADRGGRQVTKAKKDRRDGAPFSGARTDGDGWGRPSGTDDNDVFSTGAPDVQPSPLPSNVRANVGGSSAQVTTRNERIINVKVNEDVRVDKGQGRAVPKRSAMQPVTMPTTPRQQRTVVATGGATPTQAVPLLATPRQHHVGDNVRSGVAVAAVTTVEPPQPRHAGGTWELWQEHRGGRRGKAAGGRTWRAQRRLYNIINETREHLVAVASGLPLPNVPRSVAMPRSNIAKIRITDAGLLHRALSRASKVQSVALRVLHGCVFRSGSRERGYNVAFQYVLESVATDIARAVWHGEEWSNVVSPAVCVHMLDMGMDLSLWFAGVHIEDRLANDEMAAYQEATMTRLISTFSTAVETAQNVDGGRVAHERLSRLAESFKELLAACMWIM